MRYIITRRYKLTSGGKRKAPHYGVNVFLLLKKETTGPVFDVEGDIKGSQLVRNKYLFRKTGSSASDRYYVNTTGPVAEIH